MHPTVDYLALVLRDYPHAFGNQGSLSFYRRVLDALGAVDIDVRDNVKEDPGRAWFDWTGGPTVDDVRKFLDVHGFKVIGTTVALCRKAVDGGSVQVLV